MESIKQIATSKLQGVNSKLQFEDRKLSALEIREKVISIGGELISTSNPDMTPWHCKCFKALGEQRYRTIASIVRTDSEIRDRSRVFSRILKDELDGKGQLSPMTAPRHTKGNYVDYRNRVVRPAAA
ncbi:MAG: hypothetical protein ACK5MU_03930 [Candidatus Saccharimonadales bacterium]